LFFSPLISRLNCICGDSLLQIQPTTTHTDM
jgi:hypothetical protein